MSSEKFKLHLIPLITIIILAIFVYLLINNKSSVNSINIINNNESFDSKILSDALQNSFDLINNERNNNLDNQERLNDIDKRIKKIKNELVSISTIKKKANQIGQPVFY